jgi:hypothetical protein
MLFAEVMSPKMSIKIVNKPTNLLRYFKKFPKGQQKKSADGKDGVQKLDANGNPIGSPGESSSAAVGDC